MTTDEQRWLEGGVTFLNQLHLVFVDGWFFFAGIGWIFLGLAALSCRNWGRAIGFVMLAAGVTMNEALLGANWSPSSGPTDQTVVPPVGLPSESAQVNAVPPHS